MPETYTNEEKITKSRIFLVREQPFFGTICMFLTPVENKNLPFKTMGTDGRNLFWDPDYVAKSSITTLKKAWMHEAGHVFFQHKRRRLGRDPMLWNCAGDLAINSVIANTEVSETDSEDGKHYKIPEGWLYDKKYENMSSEEIYTLLEKDGFPCCKCPGSGTPASGDGTGIPCNDPTHVHPFDESMPLPDDIAGDEAKMKEFREAWKLRFASASEAAKSRGLLPGGVEEIVKELMQPEVDWRSIIRNFLTSTSKNDYRWIPPNRRFLHSGSLLPSLKSEGGLVAFVIDTSGSMSIDDITKCVSEVKGAMSMLPTMRVLLIGCDAAVQSEQMIENESEFPITWPARGRGGTSMPVAIRHIQKRMQDDGLEIKACLVCTDMMTDFGEEPQEFPVLWATTVRGAKGPYGDTIEIKD